MHRCINTSFGVPDRIYRSPCEIRREMDSIRSSIARINSSLNIRSLLLDIYAPDGSESPEELIKALSEALGAAEDAMIELEGLYDELEMLGEELREVKCEMGI